MSKIQLNATSGGGSVALEGPASLGSDKIIKFPTAPAVVVQIVQQTSTTMATSTSGTYATTGLEASITPTSTSSKVLIKMVSPMTGFAGGTTDNRGALKVFRGGSSGTSISGRLSTFYSEDDFYGDAVITFLDSPSTTSSTTYTIMMARHNGSGIYSFNRDGAQTASLVLMELAG